MMPVPLLDPSSIFQYPSGPLFVCGHFVYIKLLFLISVMTGNTWCPLLKIGNDSTDVLEKIEVQCFPALASVGTILAEVDQICLPSSCQRLILQQA